MSRIKVRSALAFAAVAALVVAVVISRRAVVEHAAAVVAMQRDAEVRVAEEEIARAQVSATELSEGTFLEATPAIGLERDERPTVSRSLNVAVVDEHGAPIEGARVEARRRGWSTVHAVAATDVRGLASVPDPGEGDELRVSASEHVERGETLDAGPWPDPYEIALARGEAVVRGLALGDRGERVAGARVEATDGVRAWRATTDDRGEFDLRSHGAIALPHELVWHVEADGYCFLLDGVAAALPRHPASGRVLVPLARWARLHVRVVDAGGTPVEGARLRLLGPPELSPVQRDWIAGGAMAIGGSAGADLALDRVPPIAALWLAVEHPTLGRREVELGYLAPGEERALTVALDAIATGSALRLRVVDPDRRPVTTGRVRVAWSDGAGALASWLDLDARGRCSIEPPASEFEFEALAPGFAPHRAKFRARDVPSEEVEIVLETSRAAIDVAVTDERGVGVAGVLVEWIDERGTLGPRTSARTDASGLARFDSVEVRRTYRVAIGGGAPGAYYLPDSSRALVPDPAQHRGVSTGSAVSFRLVEPAAIEGRVAAAAGARVHASCFESTDAEPPPAFTIGVECSADGAFRLGGLPPGRYRVWSPAASSSLESPLAIVDLASGEVRALSGHR